MGVTWVQHVQDHDPARTGQQRHAPDPGVRFGGKIAVVFEHCVVGAVLLLLAHIIRHSLHLDAEQLRLLYISAVACRSLPFAGACRLTAPRQLHLPRVKPCQMYSVLCTEVHAWQPGDVPCHSAVLSSWCFARVLGQLRCTQTAVFVAGAGHVQTLGRFEVCSWQPELC